MELKPLSHFINFDTESVDDDFVLIELQKKYGYFLEHLTKMEKLFLVSMIATHRICREGIKMTYRREIYGIMDKVSHELTTEEQEGLLAALADGILNQKSEFNRHLEQ